MKRDYNGLFLPENLKLAMSGLKNRFFSFSPLSRESKIVLFILSTFSLLPKYI